jgi:ABC-type multidrug transport system ATPase subunit
MGASGSGKTSLLNVLAGRESRISGDVLYNGRPLSNAIRKTNAFIEQFDFFFEELTVFEHLLFHAKLRMPNSTHQARTLSIHNVLKQLGLFELRASRIGIVGKGGISGGERRRVALAEALLLNPSVLLLDETVSGLDSYYANAIIKLLKKLSARGRTIIITIHQPNSEMFQEFDSVVFMAKGRCAWHGSGSDALQHFENAGFNCPTHFNPADFIINLLSQEPGNWDASTKRVHALCDFYADSTYAKRVQTDIDTVVSTLSDAAGSDVTGSQESRFAASWCTQLTAQMSRFWTIHKRSTMLTKARLAQTLFFAVLISLLYYQIDNSQKGVQDKMGAIFFILVNQSFSAVFSGASLPSRTM